MQLADQVANNDNDVEEENDRNMATWKARQDAYVKQRVEQYIAGLDAEAEKQRSKTQEVFLLLLGVLLLLQ
jgi:hypothetical protein